MEADVLIAQKQNVHVISTDSDYLFHKNVVALHRFKLSVYSKLVSIVSTLKSDILVKLNLDSNKWTLLGIVNKNDYNGNINGYGLVKNFKKIKKLRVSRSISALLKGYCLTFRPPAQVNTFGNSLSIFGSQRV